MNLREQVGQLIIAGVEGSELSSLERAWLKLIRPGGIILFRRNIEEPTQVTSLLREATEISGAPLLRCVDLEGGLVDRLRDLIAPMPSAADVFASGKPAHFARHGRLIAREAKAIGFNVVLAPVLDLALPVSQSVMRSRVVSPDPAAVAAYAQRFVEGLSAESILGCGKHFPGLGGGTLDSHHAMPLINRSWSDLWAQDLAPFRALAPHLPMMMVSHAAYPRTKDRIPASISPFWITTILKKRIGYRGLVLSDDMEMGGILTQTSIEDAAIKAILAGTDLIEICRDPSLILRAYEAVLSEAERSAAFRRRVASSYRRILEWKHRSLDARMPRPASAAQIQKIRTAVLKFTGELQ
ncbi:MAG TPA: beta-N-acetylhexosaminidase [Acidobacteriaceae bacterium]|nr:beta-N-acetylhexosaminidase [Acidobacteriaceae bacterium]